MHLFDSHFHIFEPNQPLQANNGFLPSDYSAQQYLAAATTFGMTGGALVASSFEADANETLIANLSRLPAGYVGIASLDSSVSDAEIHRLHEAGVRGIRFNLRRLQLESPQKLMDLALRVHRLHAWHTELYVDSTQLGELRPLLYELPAFSIDHLGLSTEGMAEVFNLVEQGARVKFSGLGRLNFNRNQVAQIISEIHAINPNALMFGSDLPSVRSSRQLAQDDINLVHELFNEKSADMILCRNALRFYRLDKITT
jgi:predicted TIM-barrel fold metal-dependent hydrolase